MPISTLLDYIDNRQMLVDNHITAIKNEMHYARGSIRLVKLAADLLYLQQKRNQLENERITLD